MKWKQIAICLALLAQGCAKDHLTWEFPPYETRNPEERIAGYRVTIQGADVIGVENMVYDWDLSFDTGLWRSIMATNECFPEITGGCHHGTTMLWSSKELPRFAYKPREGATYVKFSGTINVITNWDESEWETSGIAFTNIVHITK